jgi:hypothetical protein
VRHIFPECPLEPLFRAAEITAPNLVLKDLDIITDRRNLRCLLGWAGGSREKFRIDAQVAGTTLLMSVWTPGGTNFCDGTPSAGYGHNFEDTFTRPVMRGSIRHNRAITYTLGGRKMLVRFEVDGCLKQGKWAWRGQQPTTVLPSGVQIKKRGNIVPGEDIIEIKSARHSKRVGQTMAQLWFSRTPWLINGTHQDGLFVNVQQRDMVATGAMDSWELANADKLRKMIKILDMIRAKLCAAAPGEQRAAIVCAGGGDDGMLRLYTLEKQYPLQLPDDVRKKWE